EAKVDRVAIGGAKVEWRQLLHAADPEVRRKQRGRDEGLVDLELQLELTHDRPAAASAAAEDSARSGSRPLHCGTRTRRWPATTRMRCRIERGRARTSVAV